MSDLFENDFVNDEAEVVSQAAGETVDAPLDGGDEVLVGELVEAAPEEAEPSEDDLFDEGDVEAVEEERPVIILRSSGGQSTYVPVDGPTTLIDLLVRAGLNFTGEPIFHMDGAEIKTTTVVPVGQTVTFLGSVKGGGNE